MKNKTMVLLRTMFKAEDVMGISLEKESRIPPALKYIGLALLLFMAGASFAPLVFELYSPFQMMGMQDFLLKLLLYLSSVMVLFFAFFYVMSVFYFSSDIESYLYLPVKPGSLVLAKFFMVLLYEIVTSIVLFYPSIIAFGIADHQGPAFYVISLITLFFLPVAPLAIMGILCMFLMRFSKLFRNKDRFTLVSSLVGIAVAVGVSNLMQNVTGSTSGELPPLLQEEGPLFTVLAIVFPAVTFMTRAILGSPVDFILYLGITILISAVILFLFSRVGEALYIDGAKGLKESGVKRVVLTERQMAGSLKKRSALLAIASKEMKTLLRTPVYFLNCILMTLILPVFFLLPLFFNSGEITQETGGVSLVELARTYITPEMVTVGIIALMGLYAGINMISATAITREGSNFSFMKYIPVSYRTQLFAKMLPSFLVEAAGLLIVLIPLLVILRPAPLAIVIGLVGGAILALFLNLVMITIDVLKPILNWTSEQKAVKQNFNAAISSMLAAAVSFLPFLIFLFTDIDVRVMVGATILVTAAGSFILIHQLPRIAERSFRTRP